MNIQVIPGLKPETIALLTGKDELDDFLKQMRAQDPNREQFQMTGALESVLYRKDGMIEVRRKNNLIVNAGRDFISDAIGLSVSRPGVMSHIGVGTGATAAAAAQTALVTETLRKAATYAHTAGTAVFTFESSFAAGEATGALTEAGIFNASSSGTMLNRVTFSVINKGADDTLTQRFTFTLS